MELPKLKRSQVKSWQNWRTWRFQLVGVIPSHTRDAILIELSPRVGTWASPYLWRLTEGLVTGQKLSPVLGWPFLGITLYFMFQLQVSSFFFQRIHNCAFHYVIEIPKLKESWLLVNTDYIHCSSVIKLLKTCLFQTISEIYVFIAFFFIKIWFPKH